MASLRNITEGCARCHRHLCRPYFCSAGHRGAKSVPTITRISRWAGEMHATASVSEVGVQEPKKGCCFCVKCCTWGCWWVVRDRLCLHGSLSAPGGIGEITWCFACVMQRGCAGHNRGLSMSRRKTQSPSFLLTLLLIEND